MRALRPELLAEHRRAYAALFRQEGIELARALTMRMMAYVALVVMGALSLCLLGVALMLGFVLQQFHWVLIGVPGVAFLLCCLCIFIVSRPLRCRGFSETRLQLSEDIKALCLTSKQ